MSYWTFIEGKNIEKKVGVVRFVETEINYDNL